MKLGNRGHLHNAGMDIVVPEGGHDTEGMKNAECLDRLLVALVTSGTTKGLDTSCVATIRRQPFLTAPIPSTAALAAAVVVR